MYVCHCNAIPEREILAAIDRLIERGGAHSISAHDVLLELNRYGKCLGCYPLIEDLVTQVLGPERGHQPGSSERPVPVVPSFVPDRERPAASGAPVRRRGGSLARRSRT